MRIILLLCLLIAVVAASSSSTKTPKRNVKSVPAPAKKPEKPKGTPKTKTFYFAAFLDNSQIKFITAKKDTKTGQKTGELLLTKICDLDTEWQVLRVPKTNFVKFCTLDGKCLSESNQKVQLVASDSQSAHWLCIESPENEYSFTCASQSKGENVNSKLVAKGSKSNNTKTLKLVLLEVVSLRLDVIEHQ